jgi:hypothetical protein
MASFHYGLAPAINISRRGLKRASSIVGSLGMSEKGRSGVCWCHDDWPPEYPTGDGQVCRTGSLTARTSQRGRTMAGVMAAIYSHGVSPTRKSPPHPHWRARRRSSLIHLVNPQKLTRHASYRGRAFLIYQRCHQRRLFLGSCSPRSCLINSSISSS